MDAKHWEDMTTEEKVERLRAITEGMADDINRALKSLKARVAALEKSRV